MTGVDRIKFTLATNVNIVVTLFTLFAWVVAWS